MQSDGPIPGLEPLDVAAGPPDVSIHLDARPDWSDAASTLAYQHPNRDDRGTPVLRLHDYGSQRWRLHYSDDTCFHVDTARGEIWAAWPEPLTLEDTATYLLGPVLGYFLRRRGHVCLHASAVAIGGGCVAFVGPAGSGKSTLAAALALRGEGVLTDDVTCLAERGGRFFVLPGYPRIRLWQDSAPLIGSEIEALPLLTPGWDKRYLPLNGRAARFHDRPAELHAIYRLGGRRAAASAAEARPLAGQDVVTELVANTYANYLLDRAQRAAEFEVLGRLARSVPVRELTLTADGSRLGEACDWITGHALA